MEIVRQAGVLASLDGKICLVSSRRNPNRWVIPKGSIEAGERPFEAALREAYEEAGICGVLGETCASYNYIRQGISYHVLVYPLRVLQVADEWPELMRLRTWFTPDVAAHYLPREVGQLLNVLALQFDDAAKSWSFNGCT